MTNPKPKASPSQDEKRNPVQISLAAKELLPDLATMIANELGVPDVTIGAAASRAIIEAVHARKIEKIGVIGKDIEGAEQIPVVYIPNKLVATKEGKGG